MDAPTIIKNILHRPREAFRQDIMQRSFGEANLFYVGLGVVSLLCLPFTLKDKVQFHQLAQKFPWAETHPRLSAIFGFLVSYIVIGVQMGVIRSVLHFYKHDVSWKALMALALWVGILFSPLTWTLIFFHFGGIIWVQSILNICFISFGISQLSKLSLMKSVLVYLIPYIALFVFTPIAVTVEALLSTVLSRMH